MSVSNRCSFRTEQEPNSVPAEIIVMMETLLRGDGLDHLQASFGHIKGKKKKTCPNSTTGT